MADQIINFALLEASQLIRNSPSPITAVVLVPPFAGAAASQLNQEEQQLMIRLALQFAAQLTSPQENEGTPAAATAAADAATAAAATAAAASAAVSAAADDLEAPPTDPLPTSFPAGNAVLLLLRLTPPAFDQLISPPSNEGTPAAGPRTFDNSEAQQQLPDPADPPPASSFPAAGNSVLMLLSPAADPPTRWPTSKFLDYLPDWFLEKLPNLVGPISNLRRYAPTQGHELLFRSFSSVLYVTSLLYMATLGIKIFFVGIPNKPGVRRATKLLTLAGVVSFLLTVILGIFLNLVS